MRSDRGRDTLGHRIERAALLPLVAIVAAFVVGCGAGAAAPATQHTPTPLATVSTTPTATVPTGFAVYRDPKGYFQLDVPTGWQMNAVANGQAGESFHAPGNIASFTVVYVTDTTVTSSDIPSVTQKYFSSTSTDAGGNGTYAHIQGPSQVILSGTSWTKEEADVDIGAGNSPLHSAVLIADRDNTAYILAYAAPDFTAAQSQYFSTMLSTFTLLK